MVQWESIAERPDERYAFVTSGYVFLGSVSHGWGCGECLWRRRGGLLLDFAVVLAVTAVLVILGGVAVSECNLVTSPFPSPAGRRATR